MENSRGAPVLKKRPSRQRQAGGAEIEMDEVLTTAGFPVWATELQK